MSGINTLASAVVNPPDHILTAMLGDAARFIISSNYGPYTILLASVLTMTTSMVIPFVLSSYHESDHALTPNSTTVGSVPCASRIVAMAIDLGALFVLGVLTFCTLFIPLAITVIYTGLPLFTVTTLILLATLVLLQSWLYFALAESSALEATLGKNLVGIRVATCEGRRPSLAMTSRRFFVFVLCMNSMGILNLISLVCYGRCALWDVLSQTVVTRSRHSYRRLASEGHSNQSSIKIASIAASNHR